MTPQEAIQELKDASNSEVRYGDTEHHYDEVMKRVEAFDMAIKALEQQPKTGRWIVIRKEYEFMGSVVNEAQGCKCSNCDWIVKLKSDFCPNCGAKMEVEDENKAK